ncbi:putative virion-associated RNA polymerase beta' subunit [Klebsiella phage N1M2]|uniref:Putative virion-associated RNA polymerase beta' subunit n=1 Tax=Klebsiella phage N1M2 TaxID=2664939 RepID=A0A6B7ZEL1_9CAUD|nr:putative virion-associated RNA polymerase beta' subunit [Klebsiella phage N1M2]QGH71927.1 putative virion-associated RNA polymerase beta' subunit [Klebsiella phage N1M2]
MHKLDYLFLTFKKRAYIRKSFLMSIFSLVHDNPANRKMLEDVPYAAIRDDETKTIYFLDENRQRVTIEGGDYSLPLFNKNEKITVDVESHDFITEKMETTVGIFLTNIVVLFESFQNRTNYFNGKIAGGTIQGIIDGLMVDNPEPGQEVPEGKASVDDCLKVTKQLDYLEGMNQVFVKASSIDVLTVHPEVIKLRDELLKQLEDEGKLDDPTAVAVAIDKVIALDAKIQYSGPSKDFFINGKFIDNARKKMFIIFDMVPDFNTGKYNLLRKSLDEGWDPDHYPEYINTAISASFDRGNATGEGGAEVKVAILLTNRIRVAGHDCGSPRTETVKLNKHNFKGWIGGFHMVGGQPKILSKVDTDLIGKTVEMRVPQYCTQPEDNLCHICCGQKLGKIENRVSAEAVYIFTQFMLTRMKAMHVSQLRTISMTMDQILR